MTASVSLILLYALVLGLAPATIPGERNAAVDGADVFTSASGEYQLLAGRTKAKRKRNQDVGFSPGFPIQDASTAEMKRELRGMRQVGARRVRLDISWQRIEYRRGQYNWTDSDRAINQARAAGLKVLVVIGYEADWAKRYDSDGRRLPPNPGEFARFVDAAAARYASRVSAWEIWNEPNLERFWSTGPNPEAYARLVDAAAARLQQRDPKATVLIGSMSPADDASDGSQLSPMTFLKRFYTASRAKHLVDAVSVHPYSYPALPSGDQPWNTFRRIFWLHKIMNANGQGGKKIWLTEFGAPTGQHSRAVSKQRQATSLVDGVTRARKLKFVGPIFIYNFRDYRNDPYDLEANFGLVDASWRKKPAYRSLSRILKRRK